MFAGVGGEILWKPVDQSWGARRGPQLRLAARLRQPRLRLLRLRRGDRAGLGLLGHRLVRHGGAGRRRPLSRRRLGRDASALTRRFANGWAVGAYFTLTDVTSEDFGEGSFDKGVSIEIPFRWTVPFETAPDQHAEPDLGLARRRRAARHLQPALSDRARLRPQPAGAELGVVLAMRRSLSSPSPSLLAACSDEGVNPIVDAAVNELNPFDEDASPTAPAGPAGDPRRDHPRRTSPRSARGWWRTSRRPTCSPPPTTAATSPTPRACGRP